MLEATPGVVNTEVRRSMWRVILLTKNGIFRVPAIFTRNIGTVRSENSSQNYVCDYNDMICGYSRC